MAQPILAMLAVFTGHLVGVRRDGSNAYSYRNGGSEATGAVASSVLPP
ncbi:MAG: hypothetical protein JO056_02295 [Alphaproteobacteria bacterium]|nr:hypothetical protein [Alphaproteobacteria bacterium]